MLKKLEARQDALISEALAAESEDGITIDEIELGANLETATNRCIWSREDQDKRITARVWIVKNVLHGTEILHLEERIRQC